MGIPESYAKVMALAGALGIKRICEAANEATFIAALDAAIIAAGGEVPCG